MLKSSDKIAIWMEASVDDDFGKLGISALRYLNNDIGCVIDSVWKGKKIENNKEQWQGYIMSRLQEEFKKTIKADLMAKLKSSMI